VAIHIKILSIKAKLMVRLFLLPLSFIHLIYCPSIAQSAENTAFGHYLNLRFDSCEALLPEIGNREYAFYLSSLIQTSKIFLSDNVNLYISKKYQEDETLRNLESLNFSEVNSNFLQSEIKIQWAILKMKYGDEFAAFWNMKQAYNISSKNINTHPDFLPSYKSMGLLYILFGIVPEKFQWILSIFGIEGDVENGLKSLTEAQDNSTNYALESRIMIALLNGYLLNKPELGFSQITEIRSQHKYLLIDYVYALIAMKNSRSQKALTVLEQAEHTHAAPVALIQIYYLLGEIYLQKGETKKSIKYYQDFIKYQKGLSLLKDSYFKIGLCHLINGEESLARQSFDVVLTVGWTKNEADTYAQNQVESGQFSDKSLYRLRFATDGGFYEDARFIQSEINSDHLTGQDLCEYYYRTGRLMQKLDEKQRAMINYEKAIEIQGDNHWYFAPNAALQLGYMHLQQNKPESAKNYFEKVFEYKNHPYEKSIRQKAKTALKSIG
jgi:tetratricopeptide (TPR) repeat protein